MNTQRSKLILLVDDEQSLLTTLSDFLCYRGYEVAKASSGEQALAKLHDITPDLVILDLRMPGMGGEGLLREISSSQGELPYPVIVLTATSEPEECLVGLAVSAVLQKPFELNTLDQTLATVFAGVT